MRRKQIPYLSFHHRVAAILGKLTGRFFLIPNMNSLGNSHEDYMFGILHAQMLGRKLFVIYPNRRLLPWYQGILVPDFLYFQADVVSPRYKSVTFNLVGYGAAAYFVIMRFVARALSKITGFAVNDQYIHPTLGQNVIWRPSKTNGFSWDEVESLDWATRVRAFPQLAITDPKVESQCMEDLQALGLPTGGWFACLHVREGGYWNDEANYRNCNPEQYSATIDSIIERGGWVIRMGDPSMGMLSPRQGLVDYAHSDKRSPLLDAYIVSRCRFFVGTSSGLMDTAILLGVPIVHTNATSYINLLPPKQGDLIIFKHIYSKSSDRMLSLTEWLNQWKVIEPATWSSADWEFRENSSDEILAVVNEFLDHSQEDNQDKLQQQFRCFHRETIVKLSSTLKFSDDSYTSDNEWYRFAAGVIAWQGRVGNSYLESWFSKR